MFAYTQEDNKVINDYFKEMRMKIQQQESGTYNFEKLIQNNMN